MATPEMPMPEPQGSEDIMAAFREWEKRKPKKVRIEFEDGTFQEFASLREAIEAQQERREQIH